MNKSAQDAISSCLSRKIDWNMFQPLWKIWVEGRFTDTPTLDGVIIELPWMIGQLCQDQYLDT